MLKESAVDVCVCLPAMLVEPIIVTGLFVDGVSGARHHGGVKVCLRSVRAVDAYVYTVDCQMP